MDLRATGLNAAPLSRSTKGEPLATRVAPKPLYSTFSTIASLLVRFEWGRCILQCSAHSVFR